MTREDIKVEEKLEVGWSLKEYSGKKLDKMRECPIR